MGKLEDNQIRVAGLVGSHQCVPSLFPPGIVDRLIVLVDQLLEIEIGRPDRWQLHKTGPGQFEVRDRMASRNVGNIQAGVLHRPRQRGTTALVANPQ